MKKNITFFWIVFFFLSVNLFGQNISIKKNRLKIIKAEIEKLESLKTKTEKKAKKVKNQLGKISNIKQSNLQKAKTILKKKKISKKNMEKYLENKIKTEKQLNVIAYNFNQEFYHLYLNKYFYKNENTFFLNSFVDKSKIDIDKLKINIKSYDKNFNKEKNEYKKLELKEKQYRQKIASLSHKISKLNSEKKKILGKMTDSQKEIAQLHNQVKQLSALIAHLMSKNSSKSYKFSSSKLPWPVKGKIIKQFGLIKKGKIKFQNNGVDIASNEGANIRAVDNGKIVFCEWFNSMGNLIIIDHLNGFKTIYAHCGSILISKGDDVIKGQVIGKVGISGAVNQPEIHFEIRKSGKPVNPSQYLENK